MATRLNKPVVRVTEGAHRGRPLVVTLRPGDVISVRQLRTHAEYDVTIAMVYDLAVKLKVMEDKRQKLKERKARREAR